MIGKAKYELGELVYLKTDNEQLARMVCEIKFLMGGTISYTLAQGTNVSLHYSYEMSRDKTFIV